MVKLSFRLLLCLILVPLAVACEQAEKKTASPSLGDPNINLETSQVQSPGIPVIIKIQGHFVPIRRIKIKSEFGGRLEDLSVVKGQAISKGNQLLRIDDEKLPLELDLLRAELQKAEAELEQSRRLATLEEPEEETVKEEVIAVQAEEPVYGYSSYREPTFSELASQIRFTSEDAGGIWPGIDPAIIKRSSDPQDAGGIWPSYGEREMVNGEGFYSSYEPPFQTASLPSSNIPESISVPGTTFNQMPQLAQLIPRVIETPTHTGSETEKRFSLDQAKIEVIRAKIALAENELTRRTLSSPLDGIVLELAASEGSRVEPDDFLLEIIQVDPIEFSFQISQDQVNFLEPGMKIKGRLFHSPGLSFEGEISFIGAELSADKKTVEVRAQVENPNDAFKVGMEGSAEVATEQKAKSWVTKY